MLGGHIDPDKQALAATVLELLLERIAGYDGPPRIITPPFRLVQRESTVGAKVRGRP